MKLGELYAQKKDLIATGRSCPTRKSSANGLARGPNQRHCRLVLPVLYRGNGSICRTERRACAGRGLGRGYIFKESGLHPVELDISLSRLARARRYNDALVCADAYAIPLSNESFDTVLLIALLEHTSDPRRILTEAHRVFKPGGRLFVVIPHDVNMSIGRLMLCKWPPRYPDHLTFFTPARLRQWTQNLFRVERGYPMPFKQVSFWLNMYYFAILKKLT